MAQEERLKIPIIKGNYASGLNIRDALPVNLEAIIQPTEINNGYLKPIPGAVEHTKQQGIGRDRGAINWNGVEYRVSGSKLIKVAQDGAVVIIGEVGDDGRFASMTYSFTYLAVASNKKLYYYDGVTFQQVTDPDLGTVLDVAWLDGYFVTTDGENILASELNDPFQFLSTNYASSEFDPDGIVGLQVLDGELYVINRHTIEVFNNVGGSGFPFRVVQGSQILRGAVEASAVTIFRDSLSFLGSDRNSPISIYVAIGGQYTRLATREIDLELTRYTEVELRLSLVEQQTLDGRDLLFVHLPDRTFVYDHQASEALGQAVWTIRTSSTDINNVSTYNIRHPIWCYDQWRIGHPTSGLLGYLSDDVGTHWGVNVAWSCTTGIIYNKSYSAQIHELELVCLTGNTALGENPTIYTIYSNDGKKWSVPKYINVGSIGDTKKRLVWLQQGPLRQYRIQRVVGNAASRLTIIALQARIEPLSV